MYNVHPNEILEKSNGLTGLLDTEKLTHEQMAALARLVISNFAAYINIIKDDFMTEHNVCIAESSAAVKLVATADQHFPVHRNE